MTSEIGYATGRRASRADVPARRAGSTRGPLRCSASRSLRFKPFPRPLLPLRFTSRRARGHGAHPRPTAPGLLDVVAATELAAITVEEADEVAAVTEEAWRCRRSRRCD